MNLGGAVHVNKTGILLFFGAVVILILYMVSSRHENKKEIISNQIDLNKLLKVAIGASIKGGLEIVSLKDNLKIQSKGLTKEGANDSVTTADFKSHCAMVNFLSSRFPKVRIVSEEKGTKCDPGINYDWPVVEIEDINNRRDDWADVNDVVIWIDPLDATQEYTERLYEYVTTMVCVAIKGVPIIGVIHNPFTNDTAWAWVGKKKSSNLAYKVTEPQDQIKFIISRSHSGKASKLISDAFENDQHKIITAAGAGYKSLRVARGYADVYVHVTVIKKWDICAGNAILNALGGSMTTNDNTLINYSTFHDVVNKDGLIATMKNHERFVNRITLK